MVVLEHFAAYMNLSIKIDDIAGFIVDRGFVDEVVFHPVDEDPTQLAGMLYHVKLSPPLRPYSSGRTFANIVYSTQMAFPSQRVVCAKELMHIFDADGYAAKSREQVSLLMQEIALPASVRAELAKLSRPGESDHNGVLLAIAALFPRDAREEMKPLYDSGKLGVEELASVAEIPESFIPLIMSDVWGKLLDTVCETQHAG